MGGGRGGYISGDDFGQGDGQCARMRRILLDLERYNGRAKAL